MGKKKEVAVVERKVKVKIKFNPPVNPRIKELRRMLETSKEKLAKRTTGQLPYDVKIVAGLRKAIQSWEFELRDLVGQSK